MGIPGVFPGSAGRDAAVRVRGQRVPACGRHADGHLEWHLRPAGAGGRAQGHHSVGTAAPGAVRSHGGGGPVPVRRGDAGPVAQPSGRRLHPGRIGGGFFGRGDCPGVRRDHPRPALRGHHGHGHGVRLRVPHDDSGVGLRPGSVFLHPLHHPDRRDFFHVRFGAHEPGDFLFRGQNQVHHLLDHGQPVRQHVYLRPDSAVRPAFVRRRDAFPQPGIKRFRRGRGQRPARGREREAGEAHPAHRRFGAHRRVRVHRRHHQLCGPGHAPHGPHAGGAQPQEAAARFPVRGGRVPAPVRSGGPHGAAAH